MKNARHYLRWMLIAALSLAALALVVACPLAYWYLRQREAARARFAPPTVFVKQPVSGVSAPAGSYLSVVATALGYSPIVRTELWADGELSETQTSEKPEGISPFYAHYDLPVREGQHMIFVRAVNAEGIIGQSLPVAVVGEPRLAAGQTFLVVPAEQGDTLADIASSYGTDPATLQELNPDLAGEGPAGGALVTVPAQPEPGEEAPPSSVGPSLPPPPAGSTPIPVPDVPPLQPVQPGVSITSTVRRPPSLAVGASLPAWALLPPFQPPAAPTDLQAQVIDCNVRLRWNDNAYNEARYDLWVAALGSPLRLLGSLQPAAGGPAWVEFPAPQAGRLSFWVDAVTYVGTLRSNIAWVEVAPQCPSTLPSELHVEALDMTVPGHFERVYCYLSFEGAPEQRLPRAHSAFIEVQAGRGDIAAWAAPSRMFLLPMPADGALDMQGECWGWSEGTLSKLGSLSQSFGSDTWDGSRRALQGDGYEIGIALQAFGTTDTVVTYGYEDPTLQAPYELRVERWGSESWSDPQEEWEWFWLRVLHWKWDGDPKGITGFNIYLDGKPYVSVDARSMSKTLTLPAWCGQKIRFQIVAVAGTRQSPLSAPLELDLGRCPYYAMVEFDWVYFTEIQDGGVGPCDTAQGYYQLGALSQTRHFWGGNFFIPFTCGRRYYFKSINGDRQGPYAHRFIESIYTDDIYIGLVVAILDYDTVSLDDFLLLTADSFEYPSLQEAQEALGCGTQFEKRFGCSDRDGWGTVAYTVSVFPNACAEFPPKQ